MTTQLPLLILEAETLRLLFLVLKWGAILLLFAGLLNLLSKFLESLNKTQVGAKINRQGLKEVVIREINQRSVDDTLAKTLIGHGIAGSLGAVLGALSGSREERVRSIRFWIKLGNGEKVDITLKPKDDLCRRLLRFLDERDYEAW